MSKLWSIPSEYIDDRRLLRQHQTVHKLIIACTKRFDEQTRNRFYNFGGYLVWRHYETVREMYLRGMRHASFVDTLWKQIPMSRRLIRYHYTKKQIFEDLKSLRVRHHKANTTSSSYGRTPLNRLAIQEADVLNLKADDIAKNGFPKDIFLL